MMGLYETAIRKHMEENPIPDKRISLELPKIKCSSKIEVIREYEYFGDLYEIGLCKFGTLFEDESHIRFAVRKVTPRKYWFNKRTPWFSLTDKTYSIIAWAKIPKQEREQFVKNAMDSLIITDYE